MAAVPTPQCVICSEPAGECIHTPQVHFNGLTPAEAERLAILAEECAEVIVAVEKIKRHGYESRNPLVFDGPTNREQLTTEMGDVRAAMILLCAAKDVEKHRVHDAADEKLVKVFSWTHHQTNDIKRRVQR